MEIATLLARFPAPTSKALGSSLPLMVTQPATAEGLATALAQNFSASGVFYESHLRRWVQGEFSQAALWREPQAWLGMTFTPARRGDFLLSPSLAGWPMLEHRVIGKRAKSMRPVPAATLEISSRQDSASLDVPAPVGSQRHQLSQMPPESLQALVRQQLELMVTPTLRWEGEVWPGMPMTLAVTEAQSSPGEERNPSRTDDASSPAPAWKGDLRIVLPNLGELSVSLQSDSVSAWQIEITPREFVASDRLHPEVQQLVERLAQGGIGARVQIQAMMPDA